MILSNQDNAVPDCTITNYWNEFQKMVYGDYSQTHSITRYTRIWNNLPTNVVASRGLNSFKNALDEHWKKKPTKYDHQHITQSDSYRMEYSVNLYTII